MTLKFSLADDLDVPEAASKLALPCPGVAHESGGQCLICDPDSDGVIEVFLTTIERDALACAMKGLPVDAGLAPRLSRLKLLERVGERWGLTRSGWALAAEQRRHLS